jgi:hypothetical protein
MFHLAVLGCTPWFAAVWRLLLVLVQCLFVSVQEVSLLLDLTLLCCPCYRCYWRLFLQLAQVQCLFVSKMLESSSFNKLLSGVRECNRMLVAAARHGNRQYGPTLKVTASSRSPTALALVCSQHVCMAAAIATKQLAAGRRAQRPRQFPAKRPAAKAGCGALAAKQMP